MRWAVLVALAAPAWSGAFSVEQSSAYYADRQFHCELIVTLEAPLEQVRDVLGDYERYPTLDRRILQARVIERPRPDEVLLETGLRACFGPFCRNVRRLERVRETPQELAAEAIPARSDVKFGETVTRLEALSADATRLTYRTRVTPGFWIPPIVGRRWLLHTMQDAAEDLFRSVESEALTRREADSG
jgi:hypothetical protein